MYTTGTTLRLAADLMVGYDELAYMQGNNDDRSRALRLHAFERVGFLIPPARGGHIDERFRAVDAGASDGTIVIALNIASDVNYPNVLPDLALAIDSDGYLLEFDGDGTTVVATVPDDATWYTLVARRREEVLAPGTIDLTSGSATIVGHGTVFTRYSGATTDGYDRGTRLRLDAADTAHAGNALTYELDTITDDEHATLVADTLPANTEAGVRVRVAGKFYETTPADPDLHRRLVLEYEVVARTTTPAAGDLLVADVMFDSGTDPAVQIIDKRAYNTAMRRKLGAGHCVQAQPRVQCLEGVTKYAVRAPVTVAAPGAADAIHPRAAPTNAAGGIIVIWTEGTATKGATYSPSSGTWTALGATIDNTSAGHPSIARLPCWDATAPTHVIVYTKAGVGYMRYLYDDGGTIGAEVAIWQATAVDPADDLEELFPIVLLNGRLLVLGAYYDDSAAAGAGQWQIRWIYSDDYAASWETNGNEGETWIVSTVLSGPTYYDCRKPTAWQAANGLLVTAWEDGGEVRWRASFFDHTLGIDPSGIASTARQGSAVPLLDYTTMDAPSIWTDGVAVGLLVVGYVANTDLVWATTSYDLSTLDDALDVAWDVSRLFRVDPGATLFLHRTNPCIVQLQTGPAWVVYGDDSGAHTEVHSDRLILSAVAAPMSLGS